ncbi:two-component system sensor histidine kinase NtrB [Thermosulfuriphilus sp.]
MRKDFEALYGQIPEAVALFEKWIMVYANQAFRDLFRLSGEMDVSWVRLFPFSSQGYGIFEIPAMRLDGSTFEAEVVILPCLGPDCFIQQVVVRDISYRLSCEEKLIQNERLAAMGKLAGEIAHEINNPLGGILLYSKLLKEDLGPESPLLVNVDKIIKLATRCRIIAKGLLNFGRPESREETLVNLNQIIQEMFSLIEDHRLFREIKVIKEFYPALPSILANRSQLEQLVLNLIINAGEAMEGGPGELYLRTDFHEARSEVEFSVSDTGCGIPEEILSRIFDPFFTTKKGGKGTGLGLSISHGIVKGHRGRIEVETAPGQGTTFRVYLPLRSLAR